MSSPASEQFPHVHPDVPRDLAQEAGRDIASRVERDGRRATVWVPVLLVRAALAHFHEADPFEQSDDLARSENRDVTHGQAT
jgi:hypothetical protein